MDDYLGNFKARKRQIQDIVSISPTGLIALPREQRMVIRALLRTAGTDGLKHGDLLAHTELDEKDLTKALEALADQGWITSHQIQGENRYRAVLRIVAKQSARSRHWEALFDGDENNPHIRSTMSADMEESLRRFLPASLFERMPDVDAMTEAVQHLSRLHRAVSSYLPLYIAEGDILTTERYSALRSGTFMFADVSGFTAMTEWLARRGTGGAETLTAVMNALFAEMLEILAKSDAQVLKFAGDALLAFFPARTDDLTDARKAIRAGLRMQRAMMDMFQPIHDPKLLDVIGREKEHHLSMTAGIARGALFEVLVGNHVQCELMIQGDLPGLAMAAEAVGVGNEVIVDEALAATLANEYTLKPAGDGFIQVVDTFGNTLDDYEVELPVRRRAKMSAMFDREPENLQEHLRVTLEKLIPAATYLAPPVLDQLVLSGDYRIPAENRYAVSMFLYVTGFAEMLQVWGAEHLEDVCQLMERYFAMAQPVIAARGGSLIRSDPYERGIKCLIIFGAPVAHTDDPLRAVDTALALSRQHDLLLERMREELPDKLRPMFDIRMRISITRGEVFAGEVGWRARREYTVMGDTVNLAARLMAKAGWGDIWIDERMHERVQYRYTVEAVAPLKLKGKIGQIQAYAVTGTREAAFAPQSAEETFVGRTLLLLTVSRALEHARNDKARQAFLLTGEVGSGKSRVAHKIGLTAQAMGFAVALGHPQPGASRSVLWSSVISSLLYIPSNSEIDEAKATAVAGLKAIGMETDIPAMLRLLFEEGGLYSYDRTSTASGAMPRRELSPLVLRFFQSYTARTPTLIVIDDVHLAGSDAHAILRDLLITPHEMPLVIIATGDPSAVLDLPADHFDVTDLNQDETIQAAASFLNTAELGSRLQEVIWQSSGGRPLFIEAQLRELSARDMLVQYGCVIDLKEFSGMPPLPEDLRDLVSARVDQLSADEQTILRTAAVLSTSYSNRIEIAAIQFVAEFDDPNDVLIALDGLDQYGLLVWDDPELCHFRHGVVQQAVYVNLTRVVRLNLHRRAIEFWKKRDGINLQPCHLGFHMSRVGLLPQAFELLTSAAQANTETDPEWAITLYGEALALLPDQKYIIDEIARLREIVEAMELSSVNPETP